MRENAYANRRDPASARVRDRLLRVARAAPVFRRPRLIVLAGLPGSGKSTFATALRAATGVTVLESDAIRELLVPRPVYLPAEHRRVFGLIRDVAATLLADGIPVVVDATNLRTRERRVYRALADELEVPLVMVWVEAPEAVVIARLKGPSGPDRRSDAGIEVYVSMKSVMQLPDQPFILVDTSEHTGPVVERLERILHEP